MRQEHSKDLYPLFRLFAENFIINGNSILTDDQWILTTSSIENCVKSYVENFQTGKRSFKDKVGEQFKDADKATKLVFAHAEWLWAFAVNDISQRTKRESTVQIAGIKESELKDVYPKGFGHAGMYHKNNKYYEIRFNLALIRFLKEKVDAQIIQSADDVIEWTEKICLYQKYDQEFPDYPFSGSLLDILPETKVAMCNILLYVAKPDDYERIASDNHKERIYNSFSGLLTEEQKSDPENNLDRRISLIRERIAELSGESEFDFYDDTDVARVWNYSLYSEGFDEIHGLQFKKAIVLFGPPGTSKTFSAKRLARALITQAYIQKKENVEDFFKGGEEFLQNRIHHLQLHANYTYEDFVGGMTLENHSVAVRKGILFDICTAAEKDKVNGMPHVLILDEINRVDLSRLFGEVFSALENREEAIRLSICDLVLKIPNNLYVIGTMNEIDFSLERVDFALRRRFLWFFYGFNSDELYTIIWHKNTKCKTYLDKDEVDRFVHNAKTLNDSIKALPELGEQYQIGHTFFGEVVEIFSTYKTTYGLVNKVQKQLYRRDGAANILWDISIKPMLEAFLGNMDRDSKSVKITELYKVYMHE